jgi:hypothetical protein
VRELIHDIRNQLAVAVATVEGFRDGMLEPTPKRLDDVLHALAEVETLLANLPRDGAGAVPPM